MRYFSHFWLVENVFFVSIGDVINSSSEIFIQMMRFFPVIFVLVICLFPRRR
jgi:hypothetical protein